MRSHFSLKLPTDVEAIARSYCDETLPKSRIQTVHTTGDDYIRVPRGQEATTYECM